MKPHALLLTLGLLCAVLVDLSAKCELLDAVQKQYVDRRVGYLSYENGFCSSFELDTSVKHCELFYWPNGLSKSVNLKGFDLNLRYETYHRNDLKYQDSVYYVSDRKQQ
ncbi:MAG: hypothetical protein AAGM67_19565, partial [Bacteroidota bacterium]